MNYELENIFLQFAEDQAEDHKDRNGESYCEPECDDPYAPWCDPAEFMPEEADAWQAKQSPF